MKGAESGLSLLDQIDGPCVEEYQPYWAVRAHLSQKSGHAREAAEAYNRAIRLAGDDAVKRFLLDQRG